MLVSEATLIKAAIDTGIAAFGKESASRKVHAQFQKLLNLLSGGATPENAKRPKANLVKKDRGDNGR